MKTESELAELDSGDDASDVDNDLGFLRTVFLEEFNVRLLAEPEVMDCVDRYFDASNQAGLTELSELGPCKDCDDIVLQAHCEIPSRLSMPKLTLFSTSCHTCKTKKVHATVGEATARHTATCITVEVSRLLDLDRDIVKSEFARVEIPEVGLELAQGTLGGKYTTIKGLIDAIVEDISNSAMNFGGSQAKLDAFLDNLRDLEEVKEPWTLMISDDMGRSFVGGPAKGLRVTVLHAEQSGDAPPDSGGDLGSA
jgi:C4-type Zn-finger protein